MSEDFELDETSSSNTKSCTEDSEAIHLLEAGLTTWQESACWQIKYGTKISSHNLNFVEDFTRSYQSIHKSLAFPREQALRSGIQHPHDALDGAKRCAIVLI